MITQSEPNHDLSLQNVGAEWPWSVGAVGKGDSCIHTDEHIKLWCVYEPNDISSTCSMQHNSTKSMLLFKSNAADTDDLWWLWHFFLRLNILGLNRGSACIFTDHNRPYGQAANLSKQMKIIIGLALRERWSDVCSASVVGPPQNETSN